MGIYLKRQLMGKFVELNEKDRKKGLDGRYATNSMRTKFNKIAYATSFYYGLDVGEIFERSRKREIRVPRQVAQYLMIEYIKENGLDEGNFKGFMTVGRYFKQNHATVIHSHELVETALDGRYGSKDLAIRS